MIAKTILDKYIDESTLNMSDASRNKTRLTIEKFFKCKSDIDYNDLTKQDFIDMFSQVALMSKNSFISYKSTINDFVKWMYEYGLSEKDIVLDFAEINYEDINRTAIYAKYYFSDLRDLISTMDIVFTNRGLEFDTFRAAALLVWYGIKTEDAVQVLKVNLDEENGTIVNPVTNEVIQLSEDVLFFLVRYRDDKFYRTNKLGGRNFSYLESDYLLRTASNSQLSVKQLQSIQSSTLRVSVDYKKNFQFKRIYASGLYYRIHEYELENGEIERTDYELLANFFKVTSELTIKCKSDLARKFDEYQEFKNYMYS